MRLVPPKRMPTVAQVYESKLPVSLIIHRKDHTGMIPVKVEMNDGVYLDKNGNEVIVINGFEYSREEFDYLVDMCGDCNI